MLIKSKNKKIIVNPVNVTFFYIDIYDRNSYPAVHQDVDGNEFSIYADNVSIADYKTFEDAENALNDIEHALITGLNLKPVYQM